jgi:sialate O-acetylesterase
MVSLIVALVAMVMPCQAAEEKTPSALKVHAIFNSNMVLQRGKPIKVWGWSKPGASIAVQLGAEKAEAKAAAEKGRWEVTFPAREASAVPQTLQVSAGSETVAMTNVVVGDVWVMTGQSNMAFPLGKVLDRDIESVQANLPMLRLFAIDPNEKATLQEDIPAEKISTKGWAVSTPQTAQDFSAIGYVYGARLQNALQIPIGIIKSARGGASIEAIVPSQMFDKHPLAKRYAESVKKRMAEFNMEATSMQVWSNQLARAKGNKLPEDKWPKKPVNGDNLTSWNIPGASASDMGSIHNGMFGVFKGFNIKGVLFHQGFNNSMSGTCRPKRYRVLMKLMVEGWREDFTDPALPVGVIEFCAGGDPQTEENFEKEDTAGGPFIREAQRLGLADVGDPVNTAFIPGYDYQIPGLHPSKKCEHGERAARWALKEIYKIKGMDWESAKLVSTETKGDTMVLKFDKGVMPDNWSPLPEGFSIAGEDGKFYKAHARFPVRDDAKNTKNAQGYDTTTVCVWSPLVKAPKGVRYAWASSPMGNLDIRGKPWLPLQSFRTDTFDWPESEDPEALTKDRTRDKQIAQEAAERCEYRRTEEAKRAVEILERLKTLGQP